MRVITIFMGVLMAAAGVWAFASNGVSFLALAFPVGLIMILDGVVEGVIYMLARGENRKDNNNWMLADAALTLILGVFIITGSLAAEGAVPYVFSLWLIFSGVIRISVALNINRKEKAENFAWTVGTGVLCIVAGTSAFMNDFLFSFGVGELLGVCFIVQALNTLELGFHMPHLNSGNK